MSFGVRGRGGPHVYIVRTQGNASVGKIRPWEPPSPSPPNPLTPHPQAQISRGIMPSRVTDFVTCSVMFGVLGIRGISPEVEYFMKDGAGGGRSAWVRVKYRPRPVFGL